MSPNYKKFSSTFNCKVGEGNHLIKVNSDIKEIISKRKKEELENLMFVKRRRAVHKVAVVDINESTDELHE